MNATRADWGIVAGLIALTLVPALAGASRLVELASTAEVTPANARFVASPLPVLVHIPAAIVYGIVGAFQFSPVLRRRHRRWHRAAGLFLVPAAVVVALSGLWMTQFYSWPAGDGRVLYIERMVVGVAMFAAVALAVDALRRRDFKGHGAWMTRAYALGMGAGTQVFTHLPWFLFVGGEWTELPRAVMMGAGWIINLVVAEWIIGRSVGHRAAQLSAPHPA